MDHSAWLRYLSSSSSPQFIDVYDFMVLLLWFVTLYRTRSGCLKSRPKSTLIRLIILYAGEWIWVWVANTTARKSILWHCYALCNSSAVPSKNAVSADINHSRYFHWTSNFWSIHYCVKRLYVHMFDMLDTVLSYGRALIVC